MASNKLVEDQNVDDVLLWPSVKNGNPAPKDIDIRSVRQSARVPVQAVQVQDPPPSSERLSVTASGLFPVKKSKLPPPVEPRQNPEPTVQPVTKINLITVGQLIALLSVYMPPDEYNRNPLVSSIRAKIGC